MSTLRQIEANRRNAAQSTGPRTAEGKETCRGNALVHGMAALVVTPNEEGEAFAGRVRSFGATFRPRDDYDAFLVGQMAGDSLRVERCYAQERELRARESDRASQGWDDDRRLAAESLGAKLAKAPALVALQLRGTSQGCDWLIERWEALALDEAQGRWDDARKARALDLLGKAPELRNAPTPLDGDADGDIEARAAFLRLQVDRLRALKAEGLDELDAREHSAAVRGFVAPSRDLKLIRRYEAAASRRFEWADRQLKRNPAARDAASKGMPSLPASIPPPSPTLPPAPPTPPLDLEPKSPAAPPIHNRRHRRALAKLARRG